MYEILDRINEGVCVCDINGKVIIWNSGCEDVYKVSKDAILGRHLGEFFPQAANLKVLETGKAIKNIRHIPRPGTEIVISAAPICDKNGRTIGCVSTDRSLGEVLELNHKLEEASQIIDDLKKRLEKVDRGISDFFIGNNKKINEELQKAIISAGTDVPILISGETGTGKEVFARFIHRESELKGEFVPVNCSAIPDTLFESEFFGYVKGAFTGADNKGKAGYFEQADGGTLFLDEISELPLTQQSKLLRVMQEGKVRRLGSEKEIPVNVRIISASNIPLEKLVETKDFRIDLYYRLKGIEIHLPPLRERKEDLEEIIYYFLEKFNHDYKRNVNFIAPDAMDALKNHMWKGNMREMENVLRQIVVMNDGDQVTLEKLPVDFLNENLDLLYGKADNLKTRMEQIEYRLIQKAVEDNGGNISKASKDLGIPRTTLTNKLNRFRKNRTKDK